MPRQKKRVVAFMATKCAKRMVRFKAKPRSTKRRMVRGR